MYLYTYMYMYITRECEQNWVLTLKIPEADWLYPLVKDVNIP